MSTSVCVFHGCGSFYRSLKSLLTLSSLEIITADRLAFSYQATLLTLQQTSILQRKTTCWRHLWQADIQMFVGEGRRPACLPACCWSFVLQDSRAFLVLLRFPCVRSRMVRQRTRWLPYCESWHQLRLWKSWHHRLWIQTEQEWAMGCLLLQPKLWVWMNQWIHKIYIMERLTLTKINKDAKR